MDLLVAPEVRGTLKSLGFHPLSTKRVCTKFYANPSDSHQDFMAEPQRWNNWSINSWRVWLKNTN